MRYSLWTLQTLVFLTAALCCIYFVLPDALSDTILLFAMAVLPAAVVTGIVYGRGDIRAFFVGTGPATLTGQLVVFQIADTWLPNEMNIKGFSVVYLIAVATSGIVGIATRHTCFLLADRDSRSEPEADASDD